MKNQFRWILAQACPLVLFFIAFMALQNLVYGQADYKPGFIVTHENDTVHGLINFKRNKSNTKQCIFKKNENAGKEIFSPEDIKAYRISGSKVYVSKEIDGEAVFLEFLVNGIVNLYSRKVKGNDETGRTELFYLENDTTLLELSNHTETIDVHGKRFEKESNQYKGMLRYSFANDPAIFPKVTTARFVDRSLINLVKEYHNDVCHEYKCIDYTKSTKTDFAIGLKVGVLNSVMRLKTSDDRARDASPLYGLQLKFKPAFLFNRWSILTGVEFSSNTFKGDYVNRLFNDYEDIYYIMVTSKIIRVPLVFQYNLPLKGIQPTLSLGYNHVFLVNADFTMSGETFQPFHELKKYNFGFTGGIGLNKQFGDHMVVNLKADYEYRVPYNTRDVLDFLSVRSLMFSVSGLYKF